MRTAITMAKTHDGKWEVLADPGVPLVEQLANFRQGLGHKAHTRYAEIRYQESDGQARLIRLKSPEAHQADKDRRAKEDQAAREAGKLVPKTALEAARLEAAEEAKRQAAASDTANAETAAAANAGAPAETGDGRAATSGRAVGENTVATEAPAEQPTPAAAPAEPEPAPAPATEAPAPARPNRRNK